MPPNLGPRLCRRSRPGPGRRTDGTGTEPALEYLPRLVARSWDGAVPRRVKLSERPSARGQGGLLLEEEVPECEEGCAPAAGPRNR